jgi:hypothetical protein
MRIFAPQSKVTGRKVWELIATRRNLNRETAKLECRVTFDRFHDASSAEVLRYRSG